MNLHFFLTNSDAGGFPNIYPRKPVVLELTNGILLAGDHQRQASDYVPDWIVSPHVHIGQYKVYIHSPHYTWISIVRERSVSTDIGNGLPLHLYVKLPEGRQFSATHFHLVDTHHQYDLSGSAVYVAMPDGSVYTSRFNINI